MEEKDWSQILADFSATKEAKPNLSQAEWLQKFPEFGNDPTLLQAAFDYDETVRSGKYPNQDELRSKFPEFWPAPARVDVSDVEQAAQNDTQVAEQAEIPTVTMPEVEQPQQSQQSQQPQQPQHFVGNVGMPESPEMENGRFAGTERQPEFVIPTEYTRENYAAVMRRAAELNAQLEKNGEESQILAQGGTMVYGDKLDELAEQSRAINRELAALGQFVEEWSKTEEAQVYFNELNDRVNQLQSVIDQNNKSNFWTRLAEVSMASEPGVMATEQGRQSVSMMQEVNEGGYDYKAAKNELRNARNQLRLERMRQNGEMTGLAFLRGLETANYYELIPFEGLTDATAILVAARDLKNGQELSESQKALLQAMQLRAEVDFNYQGNNTVWERVGQSAPEQLAFTLQFVLGAGLTGATATGERVAAKEAERAAIRYARKGVNSSARRFVGGTVLPKLEGMAVGATIQTFANPLSVEGIVEDFERRYAGDIYYDNEGNLHVFDNNRSAGQAAYQAIASAWIENFTEYAGENITKSFKLADSKMFDLAGKFDNVMKRTGASRIADVFAIPKELGHLTQIGSAPEEFLEEELGSVMNALFATDSQRGESYGDAFKRTIGQSFSGEQQLETLLSVTITSMLLGGGGNAVNAVGNADYRRQVNRSVEKSRALLDHVNIDVDELDSQIDNGQISDIAQWLKEQSDANGWSQDEQGAAVSYVLNRARQIGMKHNDDTAIAEAQEQMRQQAQDMANRWDGQIYNATWKDGNGQEQPVTIVNGRVHYTTRENGTVHFDPYTSSGMVAIRLSDGTKKQVPARDITGIQSVMSVDEQLQSQEQTIPQMMRSQFEQEGLAIPTVESVWGGSFVAGQTQLENGMYTYIGQDSEGRYAFQNNDPKSSKDMPILYITERQLVEYGLSLNIQSAEDQMRQEAQEALDFMQLLDGIRQEASESQQWDLVKAYAERAVEFDEAGQVSPDTDPRVYAPYLLACAEGSYENAISGIDQSVAALISAQSQQAQGTDISTDAGFNAETHADMEHLDERTARLVEFYTKTREALIEMQQGQQEAMEESIAETPVSQMGIDQAFPVTWNGQQAEAVVTGIDADQRRVVTVRDMEGNDIESGIDDMSDEQWEAVRVKPEAEQQAPQEETPVQQEEQEQQTQEIEQNQPEIEQNTEEIEQQEPETAQPEAPKSPAEQTYEGLELKFGEKAGHKVDVTVDDRAKTLEKAKKALDKAQKEYDDAPIGKEEKFEKALEKAQQEYEEALADKQAWDEVKSVRDRRAAERIAAQQAEDEQRRQQAVAEEEARKAEEAKKAAEREATGANNVAPSIRGKWDGAPRIEGNQDEITLANGERITGRYMLVESGAASASHDALNGFRKTEGFPIDENDQSVNDRDYERDQHAQQITRQMANEYDSRALQDPVVVSRDGVVLSGNGRTMAGEIAASQGTDGAYIDYLKRFPQKYGFTPEQVGSMAHPRLVFVPDADMPYTSETFAKFNQQEMKGQSKTEQAVKLGKLVDDDTFKRIIRSINRFDTLGDFYADPKAAADAIDELQNAGVINQMQRSEMFDGETISAQGREIIENMLIGKAFESNPDAVRQLTEVKGLRQSIITALAEISNNIALGEYSLESELSKAIGLAYQARKSGFRAGDRVSEFARTGVLFEGESLTVASDGATETDYTNATVLMLADLINDTRSTQLKKTLAIYNRKAEQSAAGQMDLFAGGVKTQQDILNEVLLLLQHGTETEQQQEINAAVQQRKDAAADSVQQDGSTGSVDEGEREPESETDEGRDEEVHGTQVQQESEEIEYEGAIPAPDVDVERIVALRQALADAYSSGDKAAIQSAVDDLKKYVDEGLDTDTPYSEEIDDYEGDDPMMRAERYITHLYQDRYLDDDEDQEYIKTGIRSVAQQKTAAREQSGYTISPAQYTTKRGKVLNMQLVKFDKELTKEQQRAANALARDLKGWWSKDDGGFMMRDTDTAQQLIEAVLQESGEKLKDSAPLSLQELRGEAEQVESTDEAVAAANEEVDTNPTEAQKEAGNYKKGHVTIDGFDISIENPAGSTRSGVDANGQPWSVTMRNSYGYIRMTEGVDGDHIDIFLSDHLDDWTGDVFVVDQVKEDGSFDEHKVMYGFDTEEEAREAYLANYSPGWNGLGAITLVSRRGFKKWVESSHRKTKPFAEYKSIVFGNKQQSSGPKQVDVNGLFQDLRTKGEAKLSDHVIDEGSIIEDIAQKLSERAEMAGTLKEHNSGDVIFSVFDNAVEGYVAELVVDGNEAALDLAKDFFDNKDKRQEIVYKVIARVRELTGTELPSSQGETQRAMDLFADVNVGDVFINDSGLSFTIDKKVDSGKNQGLRIQWEQKVQDGQNGRGSKIFNPLHFLKYVEDNGMRKASADNEGETTAQQQATANGYGAKNKLVSQDRYEELKRKMKDKLNGQMNVGIDPEILAIGTEMAVYHIEAGARKFADFCRNMVADLGDAIRPYLKAFYNGARDLPEMEEAGYLEELTPYDEVKSFDVTGFDKGGSTFEETAQEAVKEAEVEQQVEEAEDKLKQQRNDGRKLQDGELSLRPATEADFESEHPTVYYQGKPYGVIMVMRSGEQIGAAQFSKPHIDRVYLTNGQDVTIDQLQVIDRDAEGKAKEKSRNGKKTSKEKKKDVSSQPDLFSGDAETPEIKPQDNGRKQEETTRREDSHSSTEVSSRESDRGRTDVGGGLQTGAEERGDDRRGDSGVQKAQESTAERTGRSSGSVQELKNSHNNHAERGTDYAPKGVDARIEANIKAIELAQQLIESGQQATPEQMAVLRQFSGWGGLGKAFTESSYGWSADGAPARLKALLGDEAYEQANMSRNSAYYTPASVIDTLWDIARAMGFKGGNVLEGSAGIGNILGLMPKDMSQRSDIHAVEIDQTTGGILSLLYPDAKVEIQGFEATEVENGSIDLAITNVPFVTGLRVNDTTGDRDLSRRFHDIHDFCIAKNIRKLREGGIGIFITSSGTLDNSARLREWIVNEGGADVVGAFRLNNETFGGTGVTSDIIIVRKRVNGRKSPHAIDVSVTSGERVATYDTGETKKIKGKEVPIVQQLSMDYNRYFIEHPEMMAGDMRFGFEEGETYRPKSKALYPSRGKDQRQMLADFVKSFEGKDWEKAEATTKQQPNVYEELGDDVKEGSMLVNKDGVLCVAQRGKAVPLEVNANKVKGHTKVECFRSYQAIKQALTDVLAYQTENDSDDGLQPLLDKLNKAFDGFVKTYGHLHKNVAINFLKNDVDWPSILALETFTETGDKKGDRVQTYGKTDIFSKRVVEKEKEPEPKTVKDGIIASIYLFGRVDVPYISQHLGMSEDEVKQEIIKQGLGFENPTTRQMEVKYEYLSGNVREKLRQAIENNADGRYDANIKALEAVVPMSIPAHLIDFSIGSSWVDPKLYAEYVKDRTGIDVSFFAAGGTWMMRSPRWVGEEQNRAFGVRSELLGETIMGTQLIEAAMQNKSITVSKQRKHYDGTTETIIDKEATQACAAKIDEIRQDFKDWAKAKMQSDPEMAEQMERVYNDMFNNYVPMEIDDDFVPEYFSGASHTIKLEKHQAKAALRAVLQPLMLAHEVGAGKTFTLITTAMEMRRLGTAKKPMIVVQNATVGQFVESAKRLYPNAKILTIEEADRTVEGRKNFYAKIKYNDWDMIVVPQSVFERIPDSEERQMAYVQEKIQEKMMVIEKMREADFDGASSIVRQSEREIEKLEEQLSQLTEAISDKRKQRDRKKEAVVRQNAEVKALEMLDRQTDDVENFDDMGIDAILVDEAHEYKHLGFATAMQRGVKGVDPSYSKKAQGVFLKAQAVMEKNNGRNVVFATGTPISNTAAEIWTFMRYLMPEETMEQYGIYYFDDFVRNFGNLQQMLEFTTSGNFKENNRFAGYINLPELVRIWLSVADIVTQDEIEEERLRQGRESKIPEMEGGKAQDIYLPQSKALRSIMKYVKETLMDYEKMTGKQKKENSHIPLVMYGIAKAAAVDVRLVMSGGEVAGHESSQGDLVEDDYLDDPHSKTNEAVRQTLRTLEETKDYRGTVAIFADVYQNKVTGFNIYEDIRRKLIAAGVPESEIVIMKSGMSVKKKLEIFEKMNRGEIRVMLGSTFTLGTGVNIQERLHTLIHLDAPNRPMDYTQRNGRILRQGNMHKVWGLPVRVLRFGVEDSLDVTAYQRLKTKGAIADSIMHGKRMIANSMENRMLEEEEDVFGDTVAQLSGSEYAMLKNQAEKDVRKYQAKQKQWEADQTYVHNQIPRLKGLIKEATGRMEQARKNLERLSKMPEHPTITIGRYTFNSLEEMADFIKEYNAGLKQDEAKMRGNAANGEKSHRKLTVNVGGIDFVFEVTMTLETQRKGGVLTPVVKRDMTYSCEALELKDVPVFQMLFRNGLDDIINHVVTGSDSQGVIESAQASIERYNRELEQLKERDGRPFENEAELRQAKERLEEYTEAMRKEMEAKEAKYADMDAEVSTATGLSQADEAEEEDEDETGTGESPISYNSFEEINDRFNKGLSELTEENADSVVLRLGMPSPVLLSSGIPNKELHLYGNKLMKKARDHGFAPTDIKDLPKALQNPIAVFVGSHNGSFAVLTEMMLNGKNTLVSIESNKRGEVEFNIISSVYGKDNSGVINWINNGKLLYADKKKTLAFVSASALFADATQIQEFISAANIVDNFENPTLEEENFSAEEQQLSLSLQFNSEEYETQDGETIGYTSLLGAASGVQTEEDSEGDRNTDSVQRGEDISSFALRRLDEGETCHVERRYRKTKQFDFTGSEKIESADDVAFIFKQLQDAAVENTFIVLVKDGRPTVIHTGMGGYAQSTVAIGTVLSAYRNINPDQVWMIHNHPSGNVVASHQDITLFNKLRSIFGDKLQDGIIIDTTSGKYGTFNENMRGEGKMQEKNDDAVPVDVYEFSKQVFEKDWNPETAFTIRNSSDVAQFVSSHRLGEHPKMSLIVLDQGGHIVGNIFLPYTSLGKKNLESVIDDVSYYVNQIGGTAAILFGNFTSQGKSTVKSLAKGLNTRDINLLDVLFTDEREAWNHGLASFAQKGWLSEERHKYGSEVHDDTFAGPEHRIADEYNRMTGYNSEEVSGFVRWREELLRSFFDGLRPLEQMQKLIEKAIGRKLRDSENAYGLATLLPSLNKAQMDKDETAFMLPLLRDSAGIIRRIMRYDKVSRKEAEEMLTNYMLAKHGLERNEWFHQQNPDAEEEDKAGLRGLAESLGENPDEYKTVAENLVQEFEDNYLIDTQDLWDSVKALTDRMLEISYESGMINKETFEELKNRHQYYIPLRGFADGTSGDLFDYVSRTPHFQSVFKKMKGRKSKADDPLANLFNMLQSAIVIGNQNKVMQNIYNLAVNSKSDLLRVSRSWYVHNDVTDEWEERFPDIPEDATADEIDAIMKQFDADMQQLRQQGQARPMLNKMELRKRVLPYQYKEHEMVAYINGRKVIMHVAGNPLVAQQLNKANTQQLGWFAEAVQGTTRFASMINTSLSPAFMFTNAARDIGFALFSATVTGGLNKNAKMVGNLFRAGWVLPRLILTGKMGGGFVKMFSKEEAAKIEQWWNEFLDNGGETGFTRTLSPEKMKGQVDEMIRRMVNFYSKDGQSGLKKATLGIIETMGRYSEDISRFAAYCLKRAEGETVKASVNEAKNVTVNFNVKGGGNSMIARFVAGCRACYSFFNASLQGINRMGRLAKENPKAFSVCMMTCLLQGAMLPWLNMAFFAMLGGDDDDWEKYENLTEYTANHNLILFVGNHKFIKIPYSQELAPFAAMGNIWFRQQMGWNHGRSVASQIGSMFLDLSPVNIGESKTMWGKFAKTITPTIAMPLTEWALNENFTASPIEKRYEWNKFDSGWEKAYENRTSKWLVDATRWMDQKSNGKIDINPSFVEHIATGMFGGIGRSGSNLLKYFSEGFQMQNAPYLRTIMFDSNPKGYMGAVSREYGRLAYEELPKMKHKVENMDVMQYSEVVNTMDYRIADIVSIYKTGKDLAGNTTSFVGIDKLEKQFKKAQKESDGSESATEYLDAMRAQINEMKMEMLDAIQQAIYENGGSTRRGIIDRVRETETESKDKYQRRHGSEEE